MVLDTVLLMSGTATKVLQLFASLSILIALHEFGHFFFARLFKTRVEKFYLFFDFLFPVSTLLNFSLFKKKVGDTEYGIGWFPLGGYVKIAGMVDESMDKEQLALPPQPWEFRSKPAWQRLFIMLGGIIVNVLLAIVIYIAVFSVYGEEYLPVKNAKYGIMTDSLGKSIGLRNGDMIVSVGGKPVERFQLAMTSIILDEAKTIEVLRNGQPVTVNIPAGTVRAIINNKSERSAFLLPRTPTVVDEVEKGSAAQKMGLKHADSIVSINGAPALFYDEVDSLKRALAGQPITMTVIRDGNPVELKGTIPANNKLGFARMFYTRHLEQATIKYGAMQAISKGFTYTYEQLGTYMTNLKMIFTSKEVKASESVGGLISFGQIFPSEFDMETFLKLTAFVSIILAFMNLLPIPGLDGGYVIFLLFEMATGKKVSDKVMEYATTVGFVILMALMLYANGMDIFRLFKH